MACAITATAGSASANSYITIADADTYHETHISSATWDGASTDEKCRALQTATRLLDQWFEWNGSASDSTQALLWPRSGVIGPNGYLEANNAIPTRIKHGCAELARQLIDNDRTADSDSRGVSSVTAGSVSVTFTGSATTDVIPDAVMGFVGWYGTKKGRSGGAVTLLRG